MRLLVIVLMLLCAGAAPELILAQEEPWVADVVRAAESGNVNAMARLAAMYLKGDVIPQSWPTAEAWGRKAAERGHSGGMYILGTVYGGGPGVKRNLVWSYQWLDLAVAFGFSSAVGHRSTVSTMMTPDQIAEAKTLSLEWQELLKKRSHDKTADSRATTSRPPVREGDGLTQLDVEDWSPAGDLSTQASKFQLLNPDVEKCHEVGRYLTLMDNGLQNEDRRERALALPCSPERLAKLSRASARLRDAMATLGEANVPVGLVSETMALCNTMQTPGPGTSQMVWISRYLGCITRAYHAKARCGGLYGIIRQLPLHVARKTLARCTSCNPPDEPPARGPQHAATE